MKRKFIAIIFALVIPLSLAACSDTQDDAELEQPSSQEAQPQNDEYTEPKNEELSQYEDIQALFSGIVPEAELKTSLKNGNRIHTKIVTSFSSDAAPEGWEEIVAGFNDALSAAHESASDYSVMTASGEILAGDETILASGFNGTIQFDKFGHSFELNEEESVNPPTISKFEYEQISVGMTLSQVREIVGGDGTLEDSIGTPGVTSLIQTYRFLGEAEGSYADILFDNYKVYSKVELFLE